MVKLAPAKKLSSPASLNSQLYVPTSVVELNSPSCVLCEYVIDTLDKYVKDKKNEDEIKKAVESDFKDFEDAVQNFCAVEAGHKIILTRNTKDYKESELGILTPLEFVSQL